jgi:tyrosinase
VRRIANEYPQQFRATYTQAAEQLRAPYWDWADDSHVPPITAAQRVRVNVPNGNSMRTEEVDNPLYTFSFPRAAVNGQFGTFNPQPRDRMVRCPNPRSYPANANANMGNRPYKQWTVSRPNGRVFRNMV